MKLKDIKINEISRLRHKLAVIPIDDKLESYVEYLKNGYDIACADIGANLAGELNKIKNPKWIPMEATEVFSGLIEDSVADYHGTKTLVMYNFGILFEEDLDIDFKSILYDMSRNNFLILLWEGVIKENRLFFLTQENGVEVSFANNIIMKLEI